MKKHTFILFILSIAFISSYAQQNAMTPEQRQHWEQRGDSAMASREVLRMKQLFTLTPEQEQAVFQAGVTANQHRRSAFKTYGRTEALRTEMAKVNQSTDSLYRSIIGETNYSTYKNSIHSRLIQKSLMTEKDSLNRINHKTQQP